MNHLLYTSLIKPGTPYDNGVSQMLKSWPRFYSSISAHSRRYASSSTVHIVYQTLDPRFCW